MENMEIRHVGKEHPTISRKVITVKNLSKNYGDFGAVKGISFSIGRGEIFGFLGPNGAGKTTTINMMIGLARPSGGSVTIAGIDAVADVKRAQAIMGIVPDESNLYNEMDGFDNLCFCGALYGMHKKARCERAGELLKMFGLEEAGNRPFGAYSKGMRRKLTIAAGIIHEPDILFLDEPTTGIDVESARQIRGLLLKLKGNGTTIFLTTHYIEEAERICDRIAFIVSGRIVAQGSPRHLMAGYSDEHIIRLSVDGDISSLGKGSAVPPGGFTVIGKADHTLTLSSTGRLPLSPVIGHLNEKGISVYEARELRPSLEDVFVKVTGIEAERLKKEKDKGGKTR